MHRRRTLLIPLVTTVLVLFITQFLSLETIIDYVQSVNTTGQISLISRISYNGTQVINQRIPADISKLSSTKQTADEQPHTLKFTAVKHKNESVTMHTEELRTGIINNIQEYGRRAVKKYNRVVYDLNHTYTIEQLMKPVNPADYANITIEYRPFLHCKPPEFLPDYRSVNNYCK